MRNFKSQSMIFTEDTDFAIAHRYEVRVRNGSDLAGTENQKEYPNWT